jgi:hypothetical protein
MAKLDILLVGEGTIDNAVIYLEDPQEKIPYFLEPKNDNEWHCDGVTMPLDDELDYSLYVVAFSGTKFKCTIENNEGGKVELSGITGKKVKNRAHLIGTKKIS